MEVKDPAYYFNNVVTALIMLLIYMFIASIFLPFGINFLFTFQAMTWVLSLIALSFILFILIIFFSKERPLEYLTKDKSLFSLKKIERFEFKNLIFLLFPMTPIVQYVILNNEMLSVIDYIIVILFFTILVIVFAYIVPWALSIIASRQVLTIVSLSFLFVIFNMPMLSESNNWHYQGSLPVQIFILSLTTALLLLINFVSKKVLYVSIIVFFLINISTSSLGMQAVAWKAPKHVEKFSAELVVEDKKLTRENDIFFLIYEAYSNYETMKHYGLENNRQLTFLEQNGFHIYHGIYSLGIATMDSLSRVFNIERAWSGRVFLAGGGAVHRILSKKGYKNYGVFQNDYNFRGLSRDQINYNVVFPAPGPLEGPILLITAILGGEFRDEVSLEGVGFKSYLEKKHKVLKREFASPKFVYSHSPNPGHSPSKGMTLDKKEEIVHSHLIGIKEANREMRKDIELLLEHNSNAIVIIAGDHGPFLTKTGYGVHLDTNEYSSNDINRLDIQDRFGTFLAIRWPDKNYATKYDIEILQDIFPAVFAYLFDDDTLFDRIRIQERKTVTNDRILGVSVEDGIIVGGKDDGKPLFKGVE